MPQFGQNLEARRRMNMKVYRRAFRLALMQFPASVVAFPHLLAEIEASAAADKPYGTLYMALEDVTLFERSHPDMSAFAASLGFSDSEMDQLFELAMSIEAG